MRKTKTNRVENMARLRAPKSRLVGFFFVIPSESGAVLEVGAAANYDPHQIMVETRRSDPEQTVQYGEI